MSEPITNTQKAFIFPGQGSQAVGMGKELYEASPSVRRVFEQADETLGFSLTKLCFEGPQEELTLTYNAQPAIFTVSVAGLTYLNEASEAFRDSPAYVAGHSLGEYSALVAAGAMKFVDALPLVRERGKLMHHANFISPGGMAAIIGLDEVTTEEICQQTGTQISNINSREQIVISGPKDKLPTALDMATARGAKKVIPLAVSSAFHSSLMEPTVEGMSKALESAPLFEPRVPVVANSSAEPVTTVEGLKKELLWQLCHCVQWLRSVEFMIGSGVSTFVEIGPGKVLSSLVKRINPTVETLNLGDILSE